MDLSRYDSNSFDIVLLFGPLYHLHEEADKRNTKATLAAWSAVVNAVENWLQNYGSLAIDCESATICLSTIDSINYEKPGRIYRYD